jgi:hypothetical protein
MIKRCNYLKTKCIVDKKSKRIKIPLLWTYSYSYIDILLIYKNCVDLYIFNGF